VDKELITGLPDGKEANCMAVYQVNEQGLISRVRIFFSFSFLFGCQTARRPIVWASFKSTSKPVSAAYVVFAFPYFFASFFPPLFFLSLFFKEARAV
jgi:hypothetical protein